MVRPIMIRRRPFLLALPALGAATALPGCGSAPETFQGKGLPFRPEEFFAGKFRSHGMFVTRLGAIERWFTATLVGAWDGRLLTFDEIFTYDDTFEDRRFWQLRRDESDPTGASWIGEATDATGPVRGRVWGSAFQLEHELDMLTLSGKRRRLGFDQWFIRTADDMAISRAAVSWYGFQVGTAQVAFQRISVGVTEGQVSPGQAARDALPAAPRTPPAAPAWRDPGRVMNAPPRR
ncbi:DUF3833 family protein [Roseomonas sp. SSH11]|uniref:DUF3833 family protein n=1 Tax=Pararoseomonas baculiformis TaxID=2820812 RepID=A0ABS4A9L8_9PROT|nr:DUF3833 family protein [Pararoseomonas baculiformis]MBP0443683.1 DUF3833 family protein [Pararoseomonas baculiformis]